MMMVFAHVNNLELDNNQKIKNKKATFDLM